VVRKLALSIGLAEGGGKSAQESAQDRFDLVSLLSQRSAPDSTKVEAEPSYTEIGFNVAGD
jgi:hypothetical protein